MEKLKGMSLSHTRLADGLGHTASHAAGMGM